mmetsp:Transcript_32898/g.69220  ORF Transcript_32898/g.69220 Transcript_32898/m.69220 type:complete len:425 (-) Transcript_32898:703-1977(-)|eukprot:CAMPEP_0172327366 /NCGR_PEP_ID=MMETSP1058-20130122/59366_1 /TAXON_ID=83371 /ORGANISM="Detonula confervacea, Strain CCMP 353" /LENGTH=424 /DNA_ID=CAMNT_0013044395 /DNA_START=126 /DNA_END=1400 /DNA_ORIENTATION=-
MSSKNNQRTTSRFDAIRIIFCIIAFGLATVNIWYAIRLDSSDGGHVNDYVVMQQQQHQITGGGSVNNGNNQNSQTAAGIKHANNSDKSTLHHDYNFTIGICTIVKDGEAYLTEWIDYHLSAMSIENIYIYDNSPNFDLQSWYANTRSHPLYSRVQVRHLAGDAAERQKRVNTDCVLRYGRGVQDNEHLIMDYIEKKGWYTANTTLDRVMDRNEGMDYLAFIDIDEFLMPQGNYTSVHSVINDYLHPYNGGSLSVNWMLFGSSNKTLYSPIPVTKRFQYRDEVPNGVVKSIVRASDFYTMKNPHAVVTLHGHPRTTSYKGAILQTKNGASDSNLPSQVLLLYHYRYTSSKEYHYKKCIRRETDGAKGCNEKLGTLHTVQELEEKGRPTHIALRTGSVFDDSAWRLFVERVPKYGMYNDEDWGDYT